MSETPAPPAPAAPSPAPEPAAETPTSRPSRPQAILKAAALWLVVAVVVGLAALVLLYRPSSDDPTPAAPQREVIEKEDRASPTVVLATDVLTTWADGDQDYDAWWSALKPVLTAGAKQAYAGTDPAQLPDLGTPTPVEMVKGVGGTTLTIYFKTAAGRFGVDLSRTDKEADWRVHRIVFPGQDSVFE